MKLSTLTLKDKKVFQRFLRLEEHELSVYAFENTYIWKKFFEIKWAIIESSLCVFFKDKLGAFLYLAPLGKENKPAVIDKCFAVMDVFNQNKEISRVENIEEKDLKFYKDEGFNCQVKSRDYICLRKDLAELKGNKFKSKRSSQNYFLKHNKFEYAPFSLADKPGCLRLFKEWSKERMRVNKEPLYQWMLEDSFTSLETALTNYKDLDLTGRVVKIEGKLKAFTFGFKLNKGAFCILFEVADLFVKGLPQFIFSAFSKELADYEYINVMDDSGLENLKKVKLSYQPVKIIYSYIAKRKNG